MEMFPVVQQILNIFSALVVHIASSSRISAVRNQQVGGMGGKCGAQPSVDAHGKAEMLLLGGPSASLFIGGRRVDGLRAWKAARAAVLLQLLVALHLVAPGATRCPDGTRSDAGSDLCQCLPGKPQALKYIYK